MALELTLNTATPVGNIQMKSPISKLLVDSTITYNDTTYPDVMDAFLAQFASATIEVIRNGQSGGAKTLINAVPVGDIAEIAARNEGYIVITKLTPGTSATARCRFTIEMNNFGAVDANNASFVRINLSGFTMTSTSFYSKSSPMVNNNYIRYESLGCLANSETVFDVHGHYAVAIPKNITVIEVIYLNGSTERMYPQELEIISADTTEIVFTVNGAITTFKNWFLYDVTLASQIKVTLPANGSIYLLSNNQF